MLLSVLHILHIGLVQTATFHVRCNWCRKEGHKLVVQQHSSNWVERILSLTEIEISNDQYDSLSIMIFVQHIQEMLNEISVACWLGSVDIDHHDVSGLDCCNLKLGMGYL